MLEFRILGPLEVVGERGPIALGGPKQRATLAILLLDANRVVSVERLADDLYSGAAPVTAVTQVQRQISELRKLLGASAIETRAPGYVIRLAPEQLDLKRFERRTDDATRELERGAVHEAATAYAEALDLWRGLALADLAHEPFAQIAIERLEEIRLAVLEQRIDAELALGRHVRLVGELEELVAEHPLRERFRGQLMLALYRSGRQADALDVYRRAREALVDAFGIEPTPALRELERAILTQDPALDPAGRRSCGTTLQEEPRAVLIVPSNESRLDALLAVAEPLASIPGRELIVARLLADDTELERAASALNQRRAQLDVPARTAAFTSLEPAHDIVRLANAYEIDLVMVDAPADLGAHRLPDDFAAILERSPSDVALLAGAVDLEGGGGVFVAFGGSRHDWAALEVGAWLASAAHVPLRLVGVKADPTRGRRDASRLLADASLAVQRITGVESFPVLADPNQRALAAAVDPASLVVVGMSPRWRTEGAGTVRHALVRDARPPVMLVHAGPRPSGLAPRESRSRFSWSVES